ncbi:MAG TPA: glycosyltransferase [Bacteroidetes bacterium]|nr:glycosyltransferase [Bacteroidota bacterium]
MIYSGRMILKSMHEPPMMHHRNSAGRICFLNSNKVWGGGEKWHYETACYLQRHGREVLVVTRKNSELYRRAASRQGMKARSLRVGNLSFLNPVRIWALQRLLKTFGVDTVVLCLPADMKLGALAARLAGVKNIIYRRGTALPVGDSAINRFLLRKMVTHVVANSLDVKKNLFLGNASMLDEGKVHVIYNGICLDTFPGIQYFKTEENHRNMLVLGNAGRMVEQKGQMYLLRVARILKDRNIPFKLMIAGTGRLQRQMKRYCRENDLQNEVVFMDFVHDMNGFYRQLDIYLSSSLHEGSSHAVLEAMAAGKPVIAFDISSMPELVADGETGYLAPFGDVEYFAGRILELGADRGKMEKMGEKARERVEQNFNFEKNIQHFIKLIAG